MKLRMLYLLDDYENITKGFIYSMFKCGLLLDEHYAAIQGRVFSTKSENSNGFRRLLTMIPRHLKLTTSVLQCLAGTQSALVPVALLVPASLHYLILKLKKMEDCTYVEAFDNLTTTMYNLHEVIKAVDFYYKNQIASIRNNLGSHTARALLKLKYPQLNTFLHTVGKDVIDITFKMNSLIENIDTAMCTGELSSIYEVSFDGIDFTLPEAAQEDAYKIFYDRCNLSYSFIASSFLCAVGLGFCTLPNETAKRDNRKLLDEILPEATKLIFTGYKKIFNNLKRVHGILLEPSIKKDSQVPDKLMSIQKTLNEFIKKIQSIYDVAQLMQTELQQTDYFNVGYILEAHCSEIEKLFPDCQDKLNDLTKNICRQVKVEHAEVLQRDKPGTAAVVEEQNIRESTAINIIKHDDPDIPINNEEYSLSVHGSDDEYEGQAAGKPSTSRYAELMDYIKIQKIVIQELNNELKKRKLITQEDNLSGEAGQSTIPTAVVLPTKQSANDRRNAGHLPEFVPQQLWNLPPFENIFMHAYPPLFPVPANAPPIPPPPPPPPPPLPEEEPFPHDLDDFGFEDIIPHEGYENLAMQIQVVMNDNNWAGVEEIFETGNEDNAGYIPANNQ